MGKLLKVAEAAELIGVSQRQIRAWLKVGRPSTLRFYNPDVPQPWMKKVED